MVHIYTSFIQIIGDEIADDNNNIGAILFECTELPVYGNCVKQKFGLPVWDALSTADFVYAASARNTKIDQ